VLFDSWHRNIKILNNFNLLKDSFFCFSVAFRLLDEWMVKMTTRLNGRASSPTRMERTSDVERIGKHQLWGNGCPAKPEQDLN
jgi:hypothetical protein